MSSTWAALLRLPSAREAHANARDASETHHSGMSKLRHSRLQLRRKRLRRVLVDLVPETPAMGSG